MLRIFLAIGFVTFGCAPVLTSQPVPRAIEGCVAGGQFISSDGYGIAISPSIGASLDLHRYNGWRLRVRGALLPGDTLILTEPPRDLGPCPDVLPALRGSTR